MSAQTITLPYQPRAWQEACHTARKRFTVLALHRRAGKTELAIMELLRDALACRKPGPMYLYVAPFLKQAKAVVWERIKSRVSVLIAQGMVRVSESELSLYFLHNGATIRLFGADNPHAMRGLWVDGVVVDEVAQIAPEVWYEVLQPALSDRAGWALFIGTPNGINLFSELFTKGQTAHEWRSARYTVYDTTALEPGEVARLRRDMSPEAFAREYLCDFSAAGEDQLISVSTAEDAALRYYKQDVYRFAPKILGVDPARFGGDRSVIILRQGMQTFGPEIYHGLDNMALAGKVVQAITKAEPDAVFVDSGAGGGVIDRVRQLGFTVVEVNFGGEPGNDRYYNKRAEMWGEMAAWLTAGGAIPNIPALKAELATPKYTYDARNKIKLEAKAEIKKRLPSSPDIADALALTFAHPVAARNDRDLLGRPPLRRPRPPYDPYAHV